MDFIFAWDEVKARRNARKHRVTFDEALSVFSDPDLVTFPDAESVNAALRTLSRLVPQKRGKRKPASNNDIVST